MGTDERIIRRDSLAAFREINSGKRVVFTNGCFDILHRGHITLLERARGFGDLLIVGVNSDRSVKRLGKGDLRPLVSEDDRIYILLGLRSVDYVTVFDEETPLETIKAVRPDVLVKGGEYSRDEIVGADFVENNGGRVERVDMVEGFSTSSLIDKMREGS